ncbi:hypothetical protein [Paenibacillus sp. UNC451MF]|uniref:hypothetical protein n=1 Tax=Paenibacillus sp. UNC451MF TaxID=1449063 RepID=UPI00048EF86B|nr:hypothetical protein [Paenibacillus sp. UNC451MF]
MFDLKLFQPPPSLFRFQPFWFWNRDMTDEQIGPWSPYRWTGSSNLLRKGANQVEVKVTNTLSGLLEGKYFDYASHTLQPVNN